MKTLIFLFALTFMSVPVLSQDAPMPEPGVIVIYHDANGSKSTFNERGVPAPEIGINGELGDMPVTWNYNKQHQIHNFNRQQTHTFSKTQYYETNVNDAAFDISNNDAAFNISNNDASFDITKNDAVINYDPNDEVVPRVYSIDKNRAFDEVIVNSSGPAPVRPAPKTYQIAKVIDIDENMNVHSTGSAPRFRSIHIIELYTSGERPVTSQE